MGFNSAFKGLIRKEEVWYDTLRLIVNCDYLTIEN